MLRSKENIRWVQAPSRTYRRPLANAQTPASRVTLHARFPYVQIVVPTDLPALRARFLSASTVSMPIAGILFWTAMAVLSRRLTPAQLAPIVGFGSGAVFPLGLLIDRLRGRKLVQDNANPVQALFLQCLVSVGLLWPLVILAGISNPSLVILGAAVLMGIVWIFYGWAADDPVGIRHAVARALGCYAAFLLLPSAWRLTAVCVVPLICYIFSLAVMKKPGPASDAASRVAA